MKKLLDLISEEVTKAFVECGYDEKYGKVLDGYWNHNKVYIIGDEIVTNQAIIDYLDNRYGRPVKDRHILY